MAPGSLIYLCKPFPSTASEPSRCIKALLGLVIPWNLVLQDSKMAALVQQLDTYSKIGIPKLHHNANFEYEDEVEEGKYEGVAGDLPQV